MGWRKRKEKAPLNIKESLIVAVLQIQLLCQDRKETGGFDIPPGNDSVNKICLILIIYFQNFLIIFLTHQVMFQKDPLKQLFFTILQVHR